MLRASCFTGKKNGERSEKKLTTRKQKEEAKVKGDIRGWFGIIPKRPRGRPKKKDKEDDTLSTNIGTSIREDTSKRTAPGILVEPDPKRMREGGAYNKWDSTEEMFTTLKTAVINSINPNAPGLVVDGRVARTTLRRYTPKFALAAKANGVLLKNVTQEMIFSGVSKAKNPPLLAPSDWKFLSEIALSRDLRSNGMSRSEMITMIMELAQ